MRVVGTAGHVDHGKSTLVAALTGINPDRLKEEQAREMTIDLGFAWLTLPNGEEIGIVDVPGHRDFIENMLAGVGGIDAALFVIAADEGVMPQTREHLAILDLLQVRSGIIVLTKVDLIDDPEWLDMVELDVHQVVQGTALDSAPFVRVSSRTGVGLAELKDKLVACLEQCPSRLDLGRPRLPIDRVFTLPGFGTVVTGTLIDGHISTGEEIELLPSSLRGRIRGLQTHKHKEETAVPGSRTAVNISGINVDQIRRGDVLAYPNKYQPTQRIDAYFRLLEGASSVLKHSSEVKLFIGASEVLARTRVLGFEEIIPGQEGWLQLELSEPVVAVRGDRYILRRPSPGETLGGGEVIDPHPAGRHKRFSKEVLQQLEAYRAGSPAEILLQAGMAERSATIRELVTRAQLLPEQAQPALQELLDSKQLILLEFGPVAPGSEVLVISYPQWELETLKAFQEVRAYHQAFALRRGMPREELKSRLKMQPRLFNALIRRWVASGELAESGSLVYEPGFQVKFNPQQQSQVARLMQKFAESPDSPPTIKECQAEVGDEIYNALIELGRLVSVSAEVVYRKEDYERIRTTVLETLNRSGTITVAQFRDIFNTSRRYGLAFLEHMDAIGVTVREGDLRKLSNHH